MFDDITRIVGLVLSIGSLAGIIGQAYVMKYQLSQVKKDLELINRRGSPELKLVEQRVDALERRINENDSMTINNGTVLARLEEMINGIKDDVREVKDDIKRLQRRGEC